MLVLTRKPNQSIMIGDDVEISVLSVTGDKVRLGIEAPREVPVFRTEVYVTIDREDRAAPRKDGNGAGRHGSLDAEIVDEALRELAGPGRSKT